MNKIRFITPLWVRVSNVLLFLLLITSCGTDRNQLSEDLLNDIPEVVDFNYHVKPILSDKCFACHGPDKAKQKGGLRLDTKEGAYAALGEDEDHFAIVPHKLSKSLVYDRMISNDPEFIMPPPEFKVKLLPEEIAIISRWIEQGAEYKPHWAFIKPKKPDLPESSDAKWNYSPIDKLVYQRLKQEGMKPSVEADKETLIRRAYFHLTGLPPTLKQIDDFLDDDTPDAYEKIIDQLLASEAYGERMATEWMDVARYADSDGYLDDKHRDFSPWRDWVIDAFNKNMPYDQFTTWQLAGDLLPGKSKESILATAFNRLHKKNSEAGIVFEEFRVEYVADRVHTLGQAFLGLSLECARCHDHKYDPIEQKDYYKLFGFFNSTHEMGHAVYGPDITPGPALLLTTDEQDDIVKFIEGKTKNIETQLRKNELESEGAFTDWLQNDKLSLGEIKSRIKKSLTAHYPFDEVGAKIAKRPNRPSIGGSRKSSQMVLSTPNVVNRSKPAEIYEPTLKDGVKGKAFFVNDFNSARLGDKIGYYERTEPFTVELWVYANKVYDDAGIFYHCETLRLGQKGYSMFLKGNHLQFIMAHSYPDNAIQITTTEQIPEKKWKQVTVTYDGSSSAEGLRIFIDGKQAEVTIEQDNLYKGLLYEYNIHTYGFEGFQIGNRDKFLSFIGGGLDEIKVYDRELTALEVMYNHNASSVDAIINNPSNSDKTSLLKEYYLAYDNFEQNSLLDSLHNYRVKENNLVNSVPEIMVMGDAEEQRPTFVLNRGVYSDPQEEVQPGAPEGIMPYDNDSPKNRLGLTAWLFDEDNPLTSRVFVNRIWQMHFGKGIVRSAEDFGNQGDLPSHPELLDWLAIDFVESGWDIKALHKAIVMSATYRQQSVISEKLLEQDPENILMARGPRYRMSAEMIRDNALAISGLLVNNVGGVSQYPYQPEGIWDELSNKSWRYPYLQKPGEGLYRRSLYSIWKRSSPPPAMLIFDAPDRSTCTVRRRATSTPLQALVMLNDPQYLEAARVMSQRVLKNNNTTQADQIETVFRSITGRKPDTFEINTLSQYYEEEMARFSKNRKDALAYLSIGEIAWDKSLDPVVLASLATISSAIMNTDEGYTLK